jgi:hypothetical protein
MIKRNLKQGSGAIYGRKYLPRREPVLACQTRFYRLVFAPFVREVNAL